MTNKLLISIQAILAAAVVLLVLLSAGLAQASEVTGTLSSDTASGSTVTGTISGGTGSTISGTVVSPEDVGGGGDSSSSGGGGSRRSSSSNNNTGEVLGAETEPDGVGGGFGTPGIPNTGTGGSALIYLATLIASFALATAGYIATRRLAP